MNLDNQNQDESQDRSNEIPENRASEQEQTGHTQADGEEQESNDASFSEQTDVTPPNQHEFPSVGNAETDFRPSNHGRSTGRMVGHEPGTEGGI